MITRTSITGNRRGTMMLRQRRNSLAPSIRAASVRSLGIEAIPARKNMVWYPSPHHHSMKASEKNTRLGSPSHCGWSRSV
jgi:hypothetical protein